MRYKDCSWFHDCEMSALHQDVPGFRTAAANVTLKRLEHRRYTLHSQHAMRWPIGAAQEINQRYGQLITWAEGTTNLTGFHALVNHPSVQLHNGVHLLSGGRRRSYADLRQHAERIYARHNNQTDEARTDLEHRWQRPLIGRVAIWDLLHLLHFTIDHTDTVLMYTSQLIHCLQVYASVRDSTFPHAASDATYKRDLMLAALIHDIGKLLTLWGVADEHVDCMNRVVDPHNIAGGLDKVKFQFNHDIFGWIKMRQYDLPLRVLDIVKLHSLREIHTIVRPTGSGFSLSVPRRPTGAQLDAIDQSYFVTLEDALRFNLRLRAADVQRTNFVRDFAHFDAISKMQTETIPRVDVEEVDVLLRQFFPGGQLVW